MIGHLRPVGFRMPEKDNPAGFCDAHGIQLRTKQAMGRRELTGGFMGAQRAISCCTRSRNWVTAGSPEAACASAGLRMRARSTTKASVGRARAHQGSRMSTPPRDAGWGEVCVGADMGASAVFEWPVGGDRCGAVTSRSYGTGGPQPIRRSTQLTLTLTP